MSKIFYSDDIQLLNQYIQKLHFDKAVILADAKTNGFCVPVLKKWIPFFNSLSVITIPDGEQNKNIDVAQFIFNEYINNELSKKSIVFHVGGGVLTDIGAFCASIYKRGIRFINIPTTLLAMCDASIGGKNGIDFLYYKNLLGSVVPAEAIFIHPTFLHTLPQRQIRSAYAEIIKHHVLQGEKAMAQIMNFVEDDFIKNETITNSIDFKNSIICDDMKDDGKRQILNFGHTIGHAIESIGLQKGDNVYLHGEAIMLGMIYESRLSEEINKGKANVTQQLIALKKRFFDEVKADFDINTLEAYILQDKKRDDDIKMSLLNSQQQCEYNISVKMNEVLEAILKCNIEI